MSTLANSFQQHSSAPAVIVPGTPPLTVSYSGLHEEITLFQKKLAAIGIGHGSVLSIALPNSYEFIVAFLAISQQRATAAPINLAYKQGEFEFYINDLSSAIILVPKGAFEQDAPAVRAARNSNTSIAECYRNETGVVLDIKYYGKLVGTSPLQTALPDDVALVLHTSGTTGKPKAVPLTHRNLTRTMKNIQATYELTPHDRTYLAMPLFHVHGLVAGFLAPLASGGSAIVPIRFSAVHFWQDFIAYKANWYTAVPTIHQILLRTSHPPIPRPNIRFIRSCSSPLSPKTFYDLETTFGAPVLEAYAMTEAAHQMTSNILSNRQPGSVGIGQGVEVKILNQNGDEVPQGTEAEICVRGENVTKGYINNPVSNAYSFTKDGFFRTGDQGKKDKDGYLIITGRIKEIINKGGEKISPIELDNIIAQHSAISEAVSFAIVDEIYGQDIGVAVVLKDGYQLSTNELREWMIERAAKFKLPKRVFFTDSIPKTATGKIQRRNVAEAILRA